jgi:high-affinity iron transporter
MFATALIVFREVIEAGLIVGIVLAVTRATPGRGRWITLGVIGGLLGACAIAAFTGRIAALFQGSGQELFNAVVLLIAVAMLTWHNVWMASHSRAMAQEMRHLSEAVVAGRKPLAALAVVCGIAVLREGSEVVLFLYGIAASGGTSAAAMIAGGILGVLAGAAVSALMYFGLLAIPARQIFRVTSALITLLAAGLASQAIAFIQQAGYLEVLTSTVWDTSWLISDGSVLGHLVHTLIGYTAQPSGAQLVVYAATIVAIVALTRIVRFRHHQGKEGPSRPRFAEEGGKA